MLQAIGIFAIASIGRAAAWLDIGAVPFVRTQRSQRRCGMKGARTHAHVIGLKDHAALFAPIIMERKDQILKTQGPVIAHPRSEEHTSELQSLMRNSYAVFCLKKKKNQAKSKATTNARETSLNPTPNTA